MGHFISLPFIGVWHGQEKWECTTVTPDNMAALAPISLRQRLCSMVFGVILLLSSSLGVIFFHAHLMPFLFVKPRLHRKLVDELIGSWLVFCAVGAA